MKFFLLMALSPIWIPALVLFILSLSIGAALWFSGVVIYFLFDAFSKGYIE